MNTLTLERLDEIASWFEENETFQAVIGYARERAARERCEALLPKKWRLLLSPYHPTSWEVYAYNTDTPENSTWVYFGSTPTEAYLALAAALETR
jgi:hypothetical protein